MTGSIGRLDGGDIGLAVGAELRCWEQDFTPSALPVSNNIAGGRDSSGSKPVLTATSYARNISSAHVEVNAPFSKALELQFALRADHCERVGGTVNPKVGMKWQPLSTTLLRASAGTGFRAPSFSELYRPTSHGTSPTFLYDGVYGNFDPFPTEKVATPDLKPEKSRQFSVGIVLEPAHGSSVTLGNSHYSAHTDDSYLAGQALREVNAYSLWDLSALWKPNKALTVRGGILNLLDTAPPYSNQSYYFLSTYDPTYTDPRGRTAFVSVAYAFP